MAHNTWWWEIACHSSPLITSNPSCNYNRLHENTPSTRLVTGEWPVTENPQSLTLNFLFWNIPRLLAYPFQQPRTANYILISLLHNLFHINRWFQYSLYSIQFPLLFNTHYFYWNENDGECVLWCLWKNILFYYVLNLPQAQLCLWQ